MHFISFLPYAINYVWKKWNNQEQIHTLTLPDEENHKGTHIFADYSNLIGDENEIGNFIYSLIEESIKKESKMKIVHKNLVILNEETQGEFTPPGFTAVAILQLDSSHFSATFTTHSYTDEKDYGLLCIDVFTCQSKDTLKVVEYFEAKLKEKYPKVERRMIQTHKRFIY